MQPKTIAIIGLGLMGGSLAAACRKKFPKSRIIGISRNRQARTVALRKKWVHQATSDLRLGIQSADFIVLCTPVDTFPGILSSLDRWSSPGTLVTDVGSVKAEICRFVRKKKWNRIKFVGAHPMAGSHERGIEAASPSLYDFGFTFVVRDKKTNPQSYSQVKIFWKRITPRVVEVNPSEHDRIVSEISHLPHVAAVGLVLAAGKQALPFAAAGFRDATRMAQGDPSIWLPILKANRADILRSLAIFEKRLKALGNALSRNRYPLLGRMLASAAKRREEI